MRTNRQLFQDHLAHTTDFPLMLEVERAEGIFLYGPNGERYIDLISGIGVSSIGHRHPAVITAIKDQLDKYLHLMVYGELVQSPQVQLAHRLQQTLPAALDTVYLVNSGSEAVEGALKMAKRFTGRSELVAFHNAYHGSTQGALSVTGSENLKRAYRPLLPDVRHIRFDNPEELEQITPRTAAVIIEPIQAEAGVRIPSKYFMQQLQKRCNETGALLIVDEIQTGFGRTGSFWGFEQFEIEPDVVLTAKGLGGGMPIGAFISRADVMRVFRSEPLLGHITTFGGHPVSCAAALATMEVIEKEDLLAHVNAKAALFRQLLQHPSIIDFRQHGLLMAVEFADFEMLKPIIDRAIELGVLTDWFLFCDNSMRIAPPLTITEAEIQEACGLVLQAISEKS
jgi:acetylornithine/succinyldiaminopimelate/putrescine aminotransferase